MITILTQEQINKFSNLGESRRKGTDALYDKLMHNEVVQDLIEELSEDLDE